MFSITGRLKGAAAGSTIAIALCLVANSAAAEPRKTLHDGKRAGVEYLDADVHISSSKTVKTVKPPKPPEVRVVVKYHPIHRNAPQNRSGRK